MKVSADRYYDEVNYMDLRVLGTLGLTDDDLADIAKTDGVKAVYGGKTVEVLHDIGESEQVVKLIALTDGVNEPRVVEGRMPDHRLSAPAFQGLSNPYNLLHHNTGPPKRKSGGNENK